jgi:hypothetical protein
MMGSLHFHTSTDAAAAARARKQSFLIRCRVCRLRGSMRHLAMRALWAPTADETLLYGGESEAVMNSAFRNRKHVFNQRSSKTISRMAARFTLTIRVSKASLPPVPEASICSTGQFEGKTNSQKP